MPPPLRWNNAVVGLRSRVVAVYDAGGTCEAIFFCKKKKRIGEDVFIVGKWEVVVKSFLWRVL